MTVIPGFGGQKFLYESEVTKIIELKKIKDNKMNLSFEIEIDGGINKESAVNYVKKMAQIRFGCWIIYILQYFK